MKDEAISTLILAGGKGSRFNDADKGLVEWQGRPLIAHLIDSLQPATEQTLISCNRNINQYQQYGDCVSDQLPGFQGPLAGIQSGLAAVRHPLCLIINVDCVVLPEQCLPRLLKQKQQTKSQVCYAHCGDKAQFLLALIDSNLLASLNDYLASGRRSVKGWYATLQTASCTFDDNAINNINQLQDLERLKTKNPSQ